jgi:superfamily I DNA and/or RNA helicase
MKEEKTILTSKQLSDLRKEKAIPRVFGGVKVILCTLAMFTAPPLRSTDLHTLLPPHSLIIDESSQITMADYLPAMYLFGEHIQRLGFVGDPRQREYYM